jgi:hypothetical protein
MGISIRHVVCILILGYIAITTASIYWGFQANLGISDWLALLLLLVFGGSFLVQGLEAIIKVLSKPKFKITPEIFTDLHPCHEITFEPPSEKEVTLRGNAVFMTLKIENVGRVRAEQCSGVVTFKGIVEKEDTLNWFYWGFDTRYPRVSWNIIPHIILRRYANNRVVNIRQNHFEHLDVLFTIKGEGVAFLTTVREQEIKIPSEFEMNLRLIGSNFEEEPRRYKIKLEAWDIMSLQEITDC